MRHIKKYAANILLAIVSVLIGLLIVEGFLRIIDYKKPIGARQMKDYFRFDQVSGFDIAENCPVRCIHHEGKYYYDIWSNEIGCLDMPYKGEKDYILLVGDSFTHHFGTFENKWGTLLEGLTGMRVLKCGVAGYGTKQELIKAERIISNVKIPPKLIVLGYFMNDLDDDYRFPPFIVMDGFTVEKRKIIDYRDGTIEDRDADYIARQARKYMKKVSCSKYDSCGNCPSIVSKIGCKIFKESLVSQKIESLASDCKSWLRSFRGKTAKDEGKELPLELDMFAFYPIKDFPWLQKAWGIHFNNLLDFKRLADKYNSRLLVVIIPAKEQVYTYTVKNKEIDLEQPNMFLSDFFQKQRIDYIDLLLPFRQYADKKPKTWMDPEKDLYMRMDKHWSKKGDLLAGLLVSQFIIENRLTVSPDSGERLKSIKEKLNNI